MKILVAEDEYDLADVIHDMLEASGYSVDVAENGQMLLDMAEQSAYDVIISDIMMPVKDGITAIKELRAAGNLTPVLFLTAKTQVDDRIEGLEAGADDYLTKPFAMGELLARVRAMTRRGRLYQPKVLTVFNVTLDTEKEELSCHNSISLAARESHVMECFMTSPGTEFTTEELLSRFWKNEDNADEDAVWMYISFLRNKLRSVGALATIKGDKGGSFSLVEK